MSPRATADSSKNPPRRASSSNSKASGSSHESEPPCARFARSTASTTAKITPRHAIHTTPSTTTSRGPPNRRESTSSCNSGREHQVSDSDISLPSVTPSKRPPRKRWEHLNRSTTPAEQPINSYRADHEPPSNTIQSPPSISQIPDSITDLQYPSVDFSYTNGTQIEINSIPDAAHLQILSSICDSKCKTSRELTIIPDEQHPEIFASKKTYSDDIDLAATSVQRFVCEEALEAAMDSDILPDSNNYSDNSSCTQIASSLPQLCSSEVCSASSSIHGEEVTSGLKYDSLIEPKASVEEPDDAYLKFEDLLTERMRYKTRIDSGNLILCAGKLCLF